MKTEQKNKDHYEILFVHCCVILKHVCMHMCFVNRVGDVNLHAQLSIANVEEKWVEISFKYKLFVHSNYLCQQKQQNSI